LTSKRLQKTRRPSQQIPQPINSHKEKWFSSRAELPFNIVKHTDTLHDLIDMERVNNRAPLTVSGEGTGFNADVILSGREILEAC
jgi:hypothetical protein